MRRRAFGLIIATLIAGAPPGPSAAAEGSAVPRLRIFLGSHPLHEGIRVVTLLPGEALELRLGGPPPPLDAADAFVLQVSAAAGERALRWQSDGGTIATEGAAAPARSRFIAPAKPGTYRLRLVDRAVEAPALAEVAVLVLTPFTAKHGRTLAGYRIGDYPQDLGLAPPRDRPRPAAVRGFVAVTPDTQDMAASAHFRMKDFLCKQQPDHFPKYVVLDLRLLDKLERLLDRLAATGGRPRHLAIMSGYRTPEYNRAIGNDTVWSRHTVGDAADVFVDDDDDGIMDDLDHDGRITRADAEVLLRAVDDLDRDASLTGGAAAYPATRAHGPFVHLDVRGHRARW